MYAKRGSSTEAVDASTAAVVFPTKSACPASMLDPWTHFLKGNGNAEGGSGAVEGRYTAKTQKLLTKIITQILLARSPVQLKSRYTRAWADRLRTQLSRRGKD